jgi:hypothetical protein
MSLCELCGNTIDPSLPGYGHKPQPNDPPSTPVCGHNTFTVNPDVVEFIKEQPKDATPEDLRRAWFKKLGIPS